MLSNFLSKNIFSKSEVDAESQQAITAFLASYRSEIFPQGLLAVAQPLQLKMVKKELVIKTCLPFPCDGELHEIAEQLTAVITQTVSFNVEYHVEPVRQHAIEGIKNIIAVSSGKGGVGKSTTAVNLAYGLIAEGCNVGILDADIYGPSIPTMLGLKGQKPTSSDGKLITPLEAKGLSAMSIGFLVDDANATVWRGPMASRAFSQLLNETQWPELDYLIVDMPPGTGDIQLTLAQQVPVAGALVITTPQDIALTDAIKGMAMFEQVKLPVLGIIENMSYHQCDNCGHQAHLFGEGGGKRIADEAKTKLLGQLPLDIRIRQDADNGSCAINENSTSEVAQLYRTIARNVAAQLYYQLDMRSPTTAEVVVD
ncbi:MAG: iron-sulfur cluster carrier protein ApbC [Cognaticolwellia sp.]